MIYNTIIIGAGPSGILAAIEIAKKGLKVCLIDQNSSIGEKLAITGGGRCNVTSDINILEFESKIPNNFKFLQSVFKQFSNTDLINYLNNMEILTKKEGNKIYLKSENSQNFIKRLKNLLDIYKVDLRLETKVTDIIFNDNLIDYVTTNKSTIKAHNYLIATGGLSYPNLGSDGSVISILKGKNLFTIVDSIPSLVPINIRNNIFCEIAGVSIEASLNLNTKKIKKTIEGELLFTHKGISGPLALNFSSFLVSLEPKSYNVHLDFLPQILEIELENIIKAIKGKEKISDILKNKLPKKLIKVLFPLDIVDFSNLSKKKIEDMICILKKYNIEIESFEGYNKAIITRGGISTKEIDPKTMKSKKIENLYFAGEIIDVDGFTGGYNLQIAFSTGYVAGQNIGGIK